MDLLDSVTIKDFHTFSQVFEKLEGFSRNLFTNICWTCLDWVNNDETCKNEIFQAFLQSFILKCIEIKRNPATIIGEKYKNNAGLSLCDYQIAGITELCKFFRIGVNGILADEPGLGKTTEISAFFQELQSVYHVSGFILVICRLSMVQNWIKALNLINPHKKFLDLSEKFPQNLKILKKYLKIPNFSESLIVLSTIDLCKSLKTTLKQVSWQVCVLDVDLFNQNILNSLKEFQVNCQILVSREKIIETEENLWHLIDLVLPNTIKTLPAYKELLITLKEHPEFLKYPNTKTKMLAILKPFLVLRTQSEVKTKKKLYYELKHYSKLTIWQEDLYNSYISDYESLKNSVKHSAKDRDRFLTLLLHIKKACNHAYLLENIEESDSISFHTHPTQMKTAPIPYFVPKIVFVFYFKAPTSHKLLKSAELFWIFHKLNLTIETGLAILYGNDIEKLIIFLHFLKSTKFPAFQLFSIKSKQSDLILPKPQRTPLNFYSPKAKASQFIIQTSSTYLSEKLSDFLSTPLCESLPIISDSHKPHSPLLKKIQNFLPNPFPALFNFQSLLIQNSGKLKSLHTLLKSQNTGKTVVLCQMARMLDILEDYFMSQHLHYTRIDGHSSSESRKTQVNKYKSDPATQFFLSTSRVCFNLDLTTSSTLILFDTDTKAEPKILSCLLSHFQSKPLHIHRLLSSSTIEEEINNNN